MLFLFSKQSTEHKVTLTVKYQQSAKMRSLASPMIWQKQVIVKQDGFPSLQRVQKRQIPPLKQFSQ